LPASFKYLREQYRKAVERRKWKISAVGFSVFAFFTFVLLRLSHFDSNSVITAVIIPAIFSLIDVIVGGSVRKFLLASIWTGVIVGGVIAWLTPSLTS